MTTDYRAELQLLFDAAESFTEPALGHHRPWAAALDRARALLGQPEPPSLKERALTLLKAMQSRSNLLHTVHPNIPNGWVANQVEFDLLYRALLALPTPEATNE